MTALLPLFSALAAGATAAILLSLVIDLEPTGPLASYTRWWNAELAFIRGPSPLAQTPRFQLAVAGLSVVLALASRQPLASVVAIVVLAAPPVLLRRLSTRRRELLSGQLDGTLTALANSLSAMPNLHDALGYLSCHLDDPMGEELRDVMAQTRLGRPLDDALSSFAARTGDPAVEAAVGAAVLGRRTGGDLPKILTSTAATVREMARLEGVLKTKTAEGRNQAWVMGLVPPALTLALHNIDPTWLEPMWRDPIGWIILGITAVMELVAIVLIRRIMAVDL